MAIVSICDALGITYTELMKQPKSFVNNYLIYLQGKQLAIKERSKAKNQTKKPKG